MGNTVGRRDLVRHGIGLGVALSFGPSLSLAQDNPASLRPQEDDLLVRVDDPDLKPLTPGDISIGRVQTMAWAMDPADKIVRNGSRLNRVLLVRLDADRLSPETQSRAAEGIVAYTAICTHTGCEVTDWLADEQLLYCPCHFSRFDPKDGARVIDGPAPRTLPALPLKLVDGTLAVAKPFTTRVAFEPA